MRRLIVAFFRDEDAQDIVEYALLTTFIGLVSIATWLSIEDAIQQGYIDRDAAEQDLWIPPEPGTSEGRTKNHMDIRTAAVLVLAVVAAVLDLRTRRLPNALTFGAAAAAFALALVQGGVSQLGWSAAGWLVPVLLFFPVFALRGLGAGDVKLLGAFGAWLGVSSALHLVLYTAVAGGLLAVVVILWRGYLKQAFRNIWLLLMVWRTGGVQPVDGLTLETARGPRLAYGVPIAVGALTTIWL